MSEGLFSRWAKRKQEVAAANATQAAPATDAVPVKTDAAQRADAAPPDPLGLAGGEAPPPQSLPSLDSLTAESDFSPFMARDVAPDMRNQAMKKLFTDPRYNVMDGLDIYIDDYSKPDPLPDGWLQLMNQSKTLRLFETVEEEAARLGGEVDVTTERASIAAPAQSTDGAVLGEAGAMPGDQPATGATPEILPDESMSEAPAPGSIGSKLTQT